MGVCKELIHTAQGYHSVSTIMFLHVLQVIFSNESNIERWSKSRQKAVDSKLGRVDAFMKVVGVPMQVGGLYTTFFQPLFIC